MAVDRVALSVDPCDRLTLFMGEPVYGGVGLGTVVT